MGQRVEPINPAGPSPSGIRITQQGQTVEVPPEAIQAGTAVEPVDPARPTAPPSLLTVARNVSSGLGDWTQGIEWVSSSCGFPQLWPRCQDDVDARKVPRARAPQKAEPFAISVLIECDWSMRDERLDAEAEALVDVGRAHAVSRALWSGEQLPADHPTLESCAGSVDVLGDTVQVIGGLLDAYSDCTGGPGGAVLHLPSHALLAEALATRVVWPDGNFYRGPGGSLVSAGPGYPTDSSTIIVSGPVEYALGGVVLEKPEGEMRTNVYQVEAVQLAIVRFDCCCVFAGEVA